MLRGMFHWNRALSVGRRVSVVFWQATAGDPHQMAAHQMDGFSGGGGDIQRLRAAVEREVRVPRLVGFALDLGNLKNLHLTFK